MSEILFETPFRFIDFDTFRFYFIWSIEKQNLHLGSAVWICQMTNFPHMLFSEQQIKWNWQARSQHLLNHLISRSRPSVSPIDEPQRPSHAWRRLVCGRGTHEPWGIRLSGGHRWRGLLRQPRPVDTTGLLGSSAVSEPGAEVSLWVLLSMWTVARTRICGWNFIYANRVVSSRNKNWNNTCRRPSGVEVIM